MTFMSCLTEFQNCFQIQARRMNRFNEGEKAREERSKYQKTAKVLTLFIVSYMAQWLSAIILYIWLFITPPPTVMVSVYFTVTGN